MVRLPFLPSGYSFSAILEGLVMFIQLLPDKIEIIPETAVHFEPASACVLSY